MRHMTPLTLGDYQPNEVSTNSKVSGQWPGPHHRRHRALEHGVSRRALDVLRRGETIADALLAHLAPVGWQHINLTGDYLWDADAGLGPDGFRLLRSAAIDLHPAVAA